MAADWKKYLHGYTSNPNEGIHNRMHKFADKRIDFPVSYTARVDVATITHLIGWKVLLLQAPWMHVFLTMVKEFVGRLYSLLGFATDSSLYEFCIKKDSITAAQTAKRKTESYELSRFSNKKRKTEALTAKKSSQGDYFDARDKQLPSYDRKRKAAEQNSAKGFSCHICGKGYKRIQALTIHERAHIGTMTKQIQ